MKRFLIKCLSSDEFLQLKEEFNEAVKAQNENRNLLSLELDQEKVDELIDRGFDIRLERQLKPEI